MDFYTKEGVLLFVQVDHISGEILGNVVERFYEAGAKNVQIVQGITKKNRPSHLIFIDAKPQDVERLEELIVRECGSSGWHRISTEHRHTRVSVLSRLIWVKTRRGCYDFMAEGKVIEEDKRNARPEFDCCVRLQKLLYKKAGISVSVYHLHHYLSEVLQQDKDELIIEEV